MEERFSRTTTLIGTEALQKLKKSKVIIFGVGGVGSFAAEAIARSGIGEIALVDRDTVSESNINRQLIALNSTIGKDKVLVMAERIADINPDCKVITHKVFYNDENDIDISDYDYVIDAIDTVSAKIKLICAADKVNVPIISSMGTGNKLCPQLFEVSDIFKTSVCPLSKVMRRELKKRNINKLKVVYSKEEPKQYGSDTITRTPASISFVPPVAGMIIASEVIKDILNF